MNYPILHDPGSIDMLLRTVSKTDPPNLVDHDYLVNLGFKREVDEGLLRLLSFLGFIDEKGHPTVLWVDYNDTEADAGLLRNSIRKAYGGLFEKYPKAYEKEGTVLMDFFRTATGASDNNAAYMILTFKVLCDLAEMGEERMDEAQAEKRKQKPAPPPPPEKKAEKPKKTVLDEPAQVPDTAPVRKDELPMRVTLNLDVEPEKDPELYDAVLKLLRRKLAE
ncbi:MAG: hypothetical protein AVO35_06395 [Candidatus Aegiribacteria sp. MLS_C]|nr:MAG: hypothetical protein AVO35_06395 [Candidatus Aegiribacteria sp. MLS_C]